MSDAADASPHDDPRGGERSRAAADASAPVAAFDLDGTITWADAFTTFLRARAGRAGFWGRTAPLAPLFPAYLLRLVSRRRIKEIFAGRFLAGAAARANVSASRRRRSACSDREFERSVVSATGRWRSSRTAS